MISPRPIHYPYIVCHKNAVSLSLSKKCTFTPSFTRMSYYRYITGVYKSYWPELNRTLRSSSVPRTVASKHFIIGTILIQLSGTFLCCVIDHFIPRYQTWTRPVMFEEPRCPQMLSTRSRILRMLQGDGDGILGDCDGILGDGDGILGDGYGILGDGDGILGDGDGQCP